MWLIIAIVIILIISSFLLLLWNRKKTNKEIQEVNIASLKYMKCLSSCPYEKLRYENQTILNAECMEYCYGEYARPLESSMSEYSEKTIVISMSECWQKKFIEEEFKSCINQILEKHSEIIDLSNTEIKPEYQRIDMEIIEATCSENKATVKVKLIEGTIEGIQFVVNGQGLAKEIEVPNIGEIKTYEIEYSEKTKPIMIDIAPVYNNGTIGNTKDRKEC